LDAARRREIDVVLVWRLDRWGRSVADLLATLQELEHLGVGFVSLTEALDLTTPAGRAMAGLLAVFAAFEREVLGERVRAGLAHARQNGTRRYMFRRYAGPDPVAEAHHSCPALSTKRHRPGRNNRRSHQGLALLGGPGVLLLIYAYQAFDSCAKKENRSSNDEATSTIAAHMDRC
jgi:hypothetical protein